MADTDGKTAAPEPVPVKDPATPVPVNDPPASKIAAEPIAPITIAMIGTGDGRMPYGVIETPGEHKPNLLIQVISPLAAVLIRFLNVYLGSLVGILTGAMATDVIPAGDFVSLFVKCAGLAFGGAALLALKDITTILTGLEKRFPLATGSV